MQQDLSFLRVLTSFQFLINSLNSLCLSLSVSLFPPWTRGYTLCMRRIRFSGFTALASSSPSNITAHLREQEQQVNNVGKEKHEEEGAVQCKCKRSESGEKLCRVGMWAVGCPCVCVCVCVFVCVCVCARAC